MKTNKTIWMCWFQGENHRSLNNHNRACIKKWRDLNPDWDIKVLSSKTIPEYVPEYSDILNNSPRRKMPAMSDLVRILLLSKYGGVWADASVYPMLPLSEFYDKVVNETGFFAYRFVPRMEKRTGIKETVSWFLCADHADHYLIKRWKEEFVKKFQSLKRWPYFTFHSTLSYLYDTDPKIKEIIDSMVHIHEGIPHSALAKRGGWENREESYLYKRPCLPKELKFPPN